MPADCWFVIPAAAWLLLLARHAVTTENYPDIMMPAYNSNKGSIVFFATFLMIGVFYILPMLLATVMDSYLAATGIQARTPHG